MSRERLVDTQDAERRRLERDIHDGAQQHLVALAVNLRLAQTLATRSPERARQVLAEQSAAAQTTIDTLVDLSRGIYPRQLTEDGVGAGPACCGGDQPGPGRGQRGRRGPLRRRRRGSRLLLLPRGTPERREARRRRPDRRRPVAGGRRPRAERHRRRSWVRPRRPSPPGTGWPTCATGSTRSAAASPGSPPTAAGPRSAAGCPRPAQQSPRWAECARGSPGCWPASALVCAIGDTLVVASFQPLLSEASIALHGVAVGPDRGAGQRGDGCRDRVALPEAPHRLAARRRRRDVVHLRLRRGVQHLERRGGRPWRPTGPAPSPGRWPRCSAARWHSPAWRSCSCSRRTAICCRDAGDGRWSHRSSAWRCSWSVWRSHRRTRCAAGRTRAAATTWWPSSSPSASWSSPCAWWHRSWPWSCGSGGPPARPGSSCAGSLPRPPSSRPVWRG